MPILTKRPFKAVLLFLCCLQVLSSRAQYYYYNDKYYGSDLVFEVGGSVGIMNSLTDIGGKKGIGKKFVKDLNWKVSKAKFQRLHYCDVQRSDRRKAGSDFWQCRLV